MSPKSLDLTKVASPIGTILLVTDANVVVSLDYEGYEQRMMRLLAKRYGTFDLVELQLGSACYNLLERDLLTPIRHYLAGDLTAIDPIPVNPGGTKFQTKVWQALRSIPAGTVMSYGELARQLGNPAAVRAVGTTNGLNPISIVLPCHRVIGANGNLTGYAGGLDRKRWLLEHEGLDITQLKQKSQEKQLSLFNN
ncbi:methylated-DNA--[protein]-cysteine S-methyltransferase [Leptolyngbyaceae cyanobacterium CCMR0082]|uniref:Methylated-DNA--protein-cysteine methyltransferase n=2 Tax=Adonisia turfae TaxID=2950184 RepID=A0A6M0S9U6_9CYAN|nr:methylated-DNA--[protein]-cysteine S-methyltransferase [Adonisia turfae]MDV3349801.1 methylated-DNA--[protein]-cysteine S-methyltransferase [Leptothoe sp. LEGE 181152]NEZ58544.1 methylated-DNA--[protein]-cysteine S-methyltransferase [Adonisia turfae CCMR0081]NEZ65190.1 methylated-DNA--[protein]-cysteine S-methyltransferase [Adonisia turfae CCMR0082]